MNPGGSQRRRWHRLVNRLCLVVGLLVASPLVAPQLLAFPHHARVDDHAVYSEQPIDAATVAIVRHAGERMRRDPLGSARPLSQPIFLTDGGWRWHWLALTARSSFALSRPLGEPVIVNRSDPTRDLMTNRPEGEQTRRLSDVLTHELAHGAIRARFGTLRSLLLPTELTEGYADHVARSSFLTDAQARALSDRGQNHPALVYWTGRKKVEQRLAANGGDVDRLFVEWR